MQKSVEKIRPPVDGRKWKRKRREGKFQNNHYSKKGGHKHRSEGNASRKKSKRR